MVQQKAYLSKITQQLIWKIAKVARIGDYMNPLLLYLMFNPKYYLEYCLNLFSNQDYIRHDKRVQHKHKEQYAK